MRPRPGTAPSRLRFFAGGEMTLPSIHREALSQEKLVAEIRAKARAIRKHSLNMVFQARQGHPGGDMSVADILATLYFGVLRIEPEAPRAPDRDRLVLSKGHASGALYA